MPEKLEARVRRSNNLAIIHFSGDVTTFAEDVVQNAYREAIRDGGRTVAIDFSANTSTAPASPPSSGW